MKKALATISLLLLAFLPCRAQTNVIFGYLADMELANVAGVAVTMSAVDQNPTLRNGIWVSKQPKTHFTDAGGRWAFTNVPFGQIEIDAQGQFLTGFINPNTTGAVNFSTLATNAYNIAVVSIGTFDTYGSASLAQSNAQTYAQTYAASYVAAFAGTGTVAAAGSAAVVTGGQSNTIASALQSVPSTYALKTDATNAAAAAQSNAQTYAVSYVAAFADTGTVSNAKLAQAAVTRTVWCQSTGRLVGWSDRSRRRRIPPRCSWCRYSLWCCQHT